MCALRRSTPADYRLTRFKLIYASKRAKLGRIVDYWTLSQCFSSPTHARANALPVPLSPLQLYLQDAYNKTMKLIERKERVAQHESDEFQAGFYLATIALYNEIYADLEQNIIEDLTVAEVVDIADTQGEDFIAGVTTAIDIVASDVACLTSEKQGWKYADILADIISTPYAHSKVHGVLASL